MTEQTNASMGWRQGGSSETEAVVIWRKSTYSEGSEGQCVEVAQMAGHGVALRDSKAVDGPMLSIAPSAWASLLADVKAGVFDSES
ncbi:DUF397 domain-containing protein [Actinomadura madurae]|uniref:DUF397 domain-containing protein n=1 Tax=Actinomadura madurae TaxID=1993 RepID=UPI0020D22B7E|nr:DUF397 domain-containing protein [Actinomadura madurae]MCP9955178.1 DUF397 domain-containing protein [Actinomadura madurae]MCP9971912.1 DUF397 domain-containing protein [Actinomadura madurae]MCP9984417.1 DUF397 domain-containing protein [Actinomadura madurae]MCQ0004032.1 DUF397 domain-containing protein [Actinomadura madurae]MCQ0020610.1 DUF397 domain-containing protein [Actinomadura madurae]